MKDIFKGIQYEIVDLKKSKANLVAKKVPIRHGDGKVTYGIRWVNPNEDVGGSPSPTQTPESVERLMEQDTNTQDSSILSEENTPKDTETQDTPPSSNEGGTSPVSRAEEYAFMDEVSSTESDVPDNPYDESYIESGIFSLPGIEDYMKTFTEKTIPELQGEEDIRERVRIVESNMYSHCASIIKDTTMESINNMKTPDTLVRNVQKGILGRVGSYSYGSLGTNPKILKHSLMAILGRDRYNEMSEELRGSNLTINLPSSVVTNVMDNGYSGKNLMDLLKAHLEDPDEALSIIDDICRETGEPSEQLEMLIDTSDDLDEDWLDVIDRLEAEFNAMGLGLEDRKPCYIAFNPGGSPGGVAKFYGDSAVEVSPELLQHCTMTESDSFDTDHAVPRIESIDHLSDLYLLRCCMDKPEQMANLDPNWKDFWRNVTSGDIPLEIQYHQSTIEPKYLKYLGDID